MTLLNKTGAHVATLDSKGRIVEGIDRAAVHLKHNIPLFAPGSDTPVDLKKILIDTESA